MATVIFPCERCGEPQGTVEVTAYGDPGPRFLPTGCPCPSPGCPFCHYALDKLGRCENVDCAMWFTVIPIPEMGYPRQWRPALTVDNTGNPRLQSWDY